MNEPIPADLDPELSLQRSEVEGVIRRALCEYEPAEHVLLYAAHHHLVWQDLNARARMRPDDLSDALNGVEAHLRKALRTYLHE